MAVLVGRSGRNTAFETPTTHAAYLNFDGTPFYFECVTNESSEASAEATEHNVEKGANISDHVRPGLDKVTIEVFVSNTPIQDPNGAYPSLAIAGVELELREEPAKKIYATPGSLINAATSAIGDALGGKQTYKATVLKSDEKMDVVKDVYSKLEEWRRDAAIGQVFLPWKIYNSMVIVGLSANRTAETGNAATMSITFQEIRLVEAQLVDPPDPTEPRAEAMVAKGRQPTSFVRDDVGTRRSLAAKFLPDLAKLVGIGGG